MKYKVRDILIVFACGVLTIVPGVTCLEKKCTAGITTPGYLEPDGDIALEYGKNLTIRCILNGDHELARGYNSSHLAFFRNNETVEPEFLTLESKMVLRLDIPHPPMSDNFYVCKLMLEDPVAVCLKHVSVGTAPQEVENFHCVSLNWDNLTCTWQPPQNYIKTKYSLSFRLPYRSGRASVYNCPNVTLDTETGNYSCYWDFMTVPIYRQSYPYYYFNLTGVNKFDHHSQDIPFNHYANVKPSRPIELRVINRTQHSAVIGWEIPYPMKTFPPGLLHRLVYLDDVDKVWREANTSLLLPNASVHYYNLTGLPYANRHYNVRLFLKSRAAIGDNYWSNFSSLTFHTLAKAPERPPDTNVGSFEVSANLHHRNVTLYWRQLKIFEENGENFMYRVEGFNEGFKIKFDDSYESKKGYICFTKLPFKSMEFVIKSANTEGESIGSSRIFVPAQAEMLGEPQIFTKASLGNGTYELMWKPPNTNASLIQSYTIFWCDHSRDRPYQCEGRLDWENVPANVSSWNYTVSEDKIYQFAISANGYGTSSGMVWASCEIIPNKAIGKIKETWPIMVDSTFIEVGWKLECPDNVGVIKGYRIFFCPIYGLQNADCREPPSNITVIKSLPDTRANITNLRPYTTYAIQVSILANHEVGPQSPKFLSTTAAGPPDPPQNPSVSNLAATEMTVSWDPPINMNGVLLYYLVHYKTSYGDWQSVKVDSDKLRKSQLTNLASYTNYTVRVEACTVACSKPSEEILVRTAIGRPGSINQPEIQNYEDSHRISWKPPVITAGTLDLYEIEMLKVTTDGNVTILYNSTETYIIIPERACQTEGMLTYLYTVRAVNFDAAEDHGAAAFTHLERVHINKRAEGSNDTWRYEGPWSPTTENTCTPGYAQGFVYWVVIFVLAILGIVFITWLLIISIKKYQKMSTIIPIMPDGLFPDSDKDIKYKLGNWNPQPKHNKEHDKQYPSSAPADEVSLLGGAPAPASPPQRDTSATTTSTSLSGSPAWTSLAPFTPATACDDYLSDTEVTPIANTDTPYVAFAAEKPKLNDRYVQASIIMDSTPKEILNLQAEPVSILPPSYVTTAPESVISPFRGAPLVALEETDSPYVTVDDTRLIGIPIAAPKKTSGYVTHEDIMFSGQQAPGSSQMPPSAPILPMERPAVPKRISAPPLINTKLANDDKRTSLNYSTIGLETPDPALSPEYCRFGWNSPEKIELHPQRADSLRGEATPLTLANLGKEDYELPLEDLMADESEPFPSTVASHYLPCNVNSLSLNS